MTNQYYKLHCGVLDPLIGNIDIEIYVYTAAYAQELSAKEKMKGFQPGFDILVEGQQENPESERSIHVAGLTLEQLAENPVTFQLSINQAKVKIGYDPAKDQLTLMYMRVFVHKMDKVEQTDQIYQNETKDFSTDKVKRVSWFAICRNKKYEISAKHLKKTKRYELAFGKAKAVLKGYDFCQAGTPDLCLQEGVEDSEWKVMLRQEAANKLFRLFINDGPFTDLPIQVDLVPYGPQNIQRGKILLNKFPMHEGGFIQYANWRRKLIKNPTVTDVYIGDAF